MTDEDHRRNEVLAVRESLAAYMRSPNSGLAWCAAKHAIEFAKGGQSDTRSPDDGEGFWMARPLRPGANHARRVSLKPVQQDMSIIEAMHSLSNVMCLAWAPNSGQRCTLKPGHEGPHVAHGPGDKALAAWIGEQIIDPPPDVPPAIAAPKCPHCGC